MKHVYKQLYKIMTKDSQSSYLQLLMSRSITRKLKFVNISYKLLQIHENFKNHRLSNQYLIKRRAGIFKDQSNFSLKFGN